MNALWFRLVYGPLTRFGQWRQRVWAAVRARAEREVQVAERHEASWAAWVKRRLP